MATLINCSLVPLTRIKSCHASMVIMITLTLGQQSPIIPIGLVGIRYFLTSQAVDRSTLALMEAVINAE